MPPLLIVGQRCKMCSRFLDPRELIGQERGGYICWRCYGNHQEALKSLSGSPPRGCQKCGVTFAHLAEATSDPDVRMLLHWKDGTYQILCEACSDKYERKRLDLYGDTQYGHMKKLK